MNSLPYIIFALVLLVLELAYFRLARHFSILDHPNNRSLHERPTIRGGGIIFPLAALLFFVLTGRPEPIFIVSLALISIIGFIDDIKSLGSSIRFAVQVISFGLIFYTMDLSEVPLWLVVIMFVVSVGSVNTFNFMDGINGITGGYGFVTLATLLFVDLHSVHFVDRDFIEAILISIVIFCFFNFRSKAICFAGDVGSLSIGFIALYLIVKLMTVSGNYVFGFFLSVYGVDSILTIIHRLRRKENIFKPHKLHLFQILVNHYGFSHIQVSVFYTMLQLVINGVIIAMLHQSFVYQYLAGTLIMALLSLAYITAKSKVHLSGS